MYPYFLLEDYYLAQSQYFYQIAPTYNSKKFILQFEIYCKVTVNFECYFDASTISAARSSSLILSSSFSKISILSIKSRLFVLTSYILHLFEIIRSILSKMQIEKRN